MPETLAAVFEGRAGSIVLKSLPTPEPKGSEVLARVLGCTLCGSDLHSFEGRRDVPVPTILGHEIVGEVAAFGPSTPAFDAVGAPLRVDDRIIWAIVAHCGACSYCLANLPQKCDRGVKYGHEPFRPGNELRGGLAEHCLLGPGTTILRLPDELPLEVACPASCATATVTAAFEAAGAVRGRRVLVLGAGMLGLTACAMAASAGASAVACVDPVEPRRAMARRFGATETIAPDGVGPETWDVALELSGNPAAFDSAWPTLRTGGTMVLVGSVYPARPVSLALEQVVRRCLTLRGIHNYGPRHLVAALKFLATEHERYPFADLVSSWLPLESTAQAFALSGRPDVLRIGVRPVRLLHDSTV